MKFESTLFAVAVASLAIAATPRFSPSANQTRPVSDRMLSREATHHNLNAGAHFSDLAKLKSQANQPGRRSFGYYESQFEEIEAMGTLNLILEEDFSLLTTGSYDAPDLNTQLEMEWGDNKEYRYPYTNFNRDYTHTPDWGAGNCFPAGGCVYFNCKQQGDQAKVNTPMVDVSANCGIAVFEFKARAKGGNYKGLLVETAETNGMAPSWRFYDTAQLFSVGTEWETFRVVFIDAGPTTIFQICGIDAGEVFIDDIKVYSMTPNVAIPQILPQTDYERDGFTANWTAVPDADHYLLTLWSITREGASDYILTDEKVTTNSYRLQNPEGDEFAYTVKAVKGDKYSYESKERGVFDIYAPTMLEPTITDNQNFTGNWEFLDLAAGYSYWVYGERTARTDGEFVVTNENFDDVAQPDGTKTEYTLDNPDDRTLAQWYPTELNQRGWKATRYAPYKGFICLDAWWYYMGVDDAGFTSPEMDFSKDGGKFTVTAKLAGRRSQNPGYQEDPSQPQWVTTQACVAVFNWNEEKGDYEQVELVYANPRVKTYWDTYTFNLTKGSARTIVGIYAVNGVDNLYIDDLRITQNYKAGESLLDPFYMHPWTYTSVADDPSSQAIFIPARNTPGKVYHKVNAVRAKMEMNPYTGEMDIKQLAEGKFSPLTLATETNEVDGVKLTPALQSTAALNRGTLTVHNPAGAMVAVYTIDGRMVARLGRDNVITAPLAAGAYIVTVGNQTYKVIGK